MIAKLAFFSKVFFRQEDRIRLQEGLEIVRLKAKDLPELPLLLSVAAMLESEVGYYFLKLGKICNIFYYYRYPMRIGIVVSMQKLSLRLIMEKYTGL